VEKQPKSELQVDLEVKTISNAMSRGKRHSSTGSVLMITLRVLEVEVGGSLSGNEIKIYGRHVESHN